MRKLAALIGLSLIAPYSGEYIIKIDGSKNLTVNLNAGDQFNLIANIKEIIFKDNEGRKIKLDTEKYTEKVKYKTIWGKICKKRR